MLNQDEITTRAVIKRTARRLFGERGIDSVSVREILAAAGHRNMGAIKYYFGDKLGLIQEILVDDARLIDTRRIEMLDDLEKSNEIINIRDIIKIMVVSAIGLKNDPVGDATNRFFIGNHAIWPEVVSRNLNVGYRRCVSHLRSLLPNYDRDVLTKKIMLMMIMMGSSLSFREEAIERMNNNDPDIYGGDHWLSEDLIDNLLDACEGVLLYKSPI